MEHVLVGGGNGIPVNRGLGTGHGLFLPRIGISYRPMAKTVGGAGHGISAASNNWRFLRNAFAAVTISDFTGLGGNAAAPAASLTGWNVVGPYASRAIDFAAVPRTGGTSPVTFPLPDAVGTTNVPRRTSKGACGPMAAGPDR